MLIPCRDMVAPRIGHFCEGGASCLSLLTSVGPPTPPPQGGSPVIQTPDKSGLPFASRGVAADRSTSPFGVRGAPGVGYLYHCITTTNTSAAIDRVIPPGQMRSANHQD